MTKVIEFDQAARMKRELEAKDLEITELKTRINNVNAVNEMLKLQLADLLDQLTTLASQIDILKNNVVNLQERLPVDLTK